jgi:hypothetical protein
MFSVAPLSHGEHDKHAWGTLQECLNSRHHREAFMGRLNLRSVTSVALIAAVFGVTGISDAFAQKKQSYEQTFAKCKQEMGGGPLGGEGLNSGPRYTAMSGCMKKYGYRLKKSSKL